MSTFAQVTSYHAVPVGTEGQQVKLTNTGDTVYYKSDPTVSSSSNDGNITNGSNATLTAPAWVISAGNSSLQIDYQATSVTSDPRMNAATTNQLPVKQSDGGWAPITPASLGTLRPIPDNVNTVAASGTTQTIPAPTSKVCNQITLTGNCTFTFPTAAAGLRIMLALKQDGTGSRTVTWPAEVLWPAATAPTLTTTAAKTDLLIFDCLDGSHWLGRSSLNY